MVELLLKREAGSATDAAAFGRVMRQAVADVVKRQVGIGVNVVGDGETSKISYATYVKDRLSGFAEEGSTEPSRPHLAICSPFPSCGGRWRRTASPGVVATFLPNQYYSSHEAYVEAVAAAIREEYEAIVAAGFVVQIDCPDLTMSRHTSLQDLSDAEFLKRAQYHVETLNGALANVPADKVRVHICWGNYEGLHTHDIDLAKILKIVLAVKAQALVAPADARYRRSPAARGWQTSELIFIARHYPRTRVEWELFDNSI